jgi:CelD/BcsL family acetyltransferase involved in cellulose biosynthesis
MAECTGRDSERSNGMHHMVDRIKEYQPSPAEAVGEIISGGSETIDQLTPQWRELCSKPCNDYHPFCRPEWIQAYFRKQENASFYLFTVKKSNELIGLLPMIQKKKRVSRLPIRVLRGPSEWLLWPSDILITTENERRVVSNEIWNKMRDYPEWDVIEFPVVPKGGVAEDVLNVAKNEGYRVHRWEHMHSPYILVKNDASKEGTMAAPRSSNLRRSLRKTIKKFKAEGGLKVHYYNQAEPDLLRRLYELEASGWKGQRGSAMLSNARDTEFYNTIAAEAGKNNYLSLTALEHRGNVVAVGLGFIYRNRLFGMKLGFDQQLKSYSLGHLLVSSMLDLCFRCGVSEFHLMGFRSSWKTQWTEMILPHSMCYIFRKGLYGFAAKQAVCKNIRWNQKAFATKSEQLEA